MQARRPYNPLLKSYPDSDRVNAVSIGAETLFTRLIAKGDDAGRYYADPGIVLGKLYTLRMCRGAVDMPTIEKWINELRDVGLIVCYWIGGKRYLEIVNPQRLIRSDARPDIQFPDYRDESVIIESVGGNGTAHGEASESGTAQEKPQRYDTAQVTPNGVAAKVAPEKSDTIPIRIREDPGKFTIGLYPDPDPDPDQEGVRCAHSLSTAAAADGGGGSGVRGAVLLPGGFVRFWEAWPKHFRKQGRSKCLVFWKSRKLERIADNVISAVERARRSYQWAKDGGEFIPLPLSWLRQTPWETPDGEFDDARREPNGKPSNSNSGRGIRENLKL